MGRLVRKIRPTNYWRIGELESWFTDMAAKGLHLKKVGLFFTQFVKGEPKKTRYRIDIDFNYDGEIEDKVQFYKENTWEYVTKYKSCFHVFSSPDELDAPEIHTDPAEQSHTLKGLEKSFIFGAVIPAIFLAIYFGFHLSIWFLDGRSIYNIVAGHNYSSIGRGILWLLFTYSAFRSAISFHNLRENLLEGKPINHNAPWKKKKRITLLTVTFSILIFIFVFVLPFIQIAKRETNSLPITSDDLPVVRLSDIENTPDLRYYTDKIQNGINISKKYHFNWSFLAPVQYDSLEQGFVLGQRWNNHNTVYSPDIVNRIYKLRYSFMVRRFFNDLVKRLDLEVNSENTTGIQHPEFDRLIVNESDNNKRVLVKKGNTVMYVSYHGHVDVDILIEVIADRISLISK